MSTTPLILVSNDDGVQAPGLQALAQALQPCGDVLVIAPDRERSGSGHAITLAEPLRVVEREPGWIVVDGTPADCIYLGLLHFCARRPAVVVSGVNPGYNLGMDVYYSGTVAAAVEAAIRGVPAIAISLSSKESNFAPAANFAVRAVGAALNGLLPVHTWLNVNVPPGRPVIAQATKLGRRVYRDRVEVRTDPRGRHYYWIGGPAVGHHDVAGSDCEAVEQGLISVTPLGLDLTEARLLNDALLFSPAASEAGQ